MNCKSTHYSVHELYRAGLYDQSVPYFLFSVYTNFGITRECIIEGRLDTQKQNIVKHTDWLDDRYGIRKIHLQWPQQLPNWAFLWCSQRIIFVRVYYVSFWVRDLLLNVIIGPHGDGGVISIYVIAFVPTILHNPCYFIVVLTCVYFPLAKANPTNSGLSLFLKSVCGQTLLGWPFIFSSRNLYDA